MNESGKDFGQYNTFVDIDEVLKSKKTCRIASASDNTKDGVMGHFQPDLLVGVLGGSLNDFGGNTTRTVIFDSKFEATILESLKNIKVDQGYRFGRLEIGGDAVSREHASVSVQNGKYQYKDLGSTNGTEFFRPSFSGNVETVVSNEPLLVIPKETNFTQLVIGIGDSSILKITKMPDDSFFISDANSMRIKNAQKLNFLQEGEAITVGSGSQESNAHLNGKWISMPDEGVQAVHFRIILKKGNLYLMNIAKSEFDLHYQGLVVKVPPVEEKKPPVEKLKRLATSVLWIELEDEIAKIEHLYPDKRKLFKQLALKHHPDRNPNDLNAQRRFQLINKWYTGVGD